MSASVVVFDYGSGNVHSALRALDRVGARTTLTADPDLAMEADGLFVPGVGNFHACAAALSAAGGDRIIAARLARGRPVLGVCVGMQVLFESSNEPSPRPHPGLGLWGGEVARLAAPIVPHMGWNTLEAPATSELFAGLGGERFYFVHSFAARAWHRGLNPAEEAKVTWATYGEPFVAAVEDGPLWATQFHPEKSGDAGLGILRTWVAFL